MKKTALCAAVILSLGATLAQAGNVDVDVHIGRLRKALLQAWKTDPIRTVRGAGYRFLSRG